MANLNAAIASRLDPDSPSLKELEYLNHDHIDKYVAARNYVLYQWLSRPDRILTWECLQKDIETNNFIDQHNVSLEILEYAFQFCHRYRYINYGILFEYYLL